MKNQLAMLTVLFAPALGFAQMPTPASNPLTRHYRNGETLTYRMTATNEDWHYTADASCTVNKTASGTYAEQFRWTAMTSNGEPVTLPPEIAQFRQPLSLDPNWMPSMPDISKVDPKMVGPITDLMTFYVDLWLMNKIGFLQHAGDHFYVPNPQVSSWADGTRVLVGKDHIDFDLNLQSIDPVKQTAVVVVRHVPPSHPDLKLSAEWMQAPVAGTANNWVEVTKTKDGKYQAGVGKETFDVTIIVSTADGRILSASMDNPVVTSGRLCEDANSAVLIAERVYQPGDRLVFGGVPWIALQVDNTIPECFVFAPRAASEDVVYEIPWGREEKETGSAYAPESFAGASHRITLRALSKRETSSYRNLALNPCDLARRDDVSVQFYPHASSNSVSRSLFDFEARNAIDGRSLNGHHGVWPYQSWGPQLRTDIWWKLDFGRPVHVNKVRVMVRADFPHDSYWKNVDLEFSDGSHVPLRISSSPEFQEFSFPSRRVEWMRIANLVPADPAKWCSLMEVEAWGKEAQ